MDPHVSILIPHYNRAALLARTLQSLVDQSYQNWQAIVVDDGSDPEEWATAKLFADPRVRFMERTDGTKGPSRCRNIGLKASIGQLVMFLDSDDILAPWCLAERITQLTANPDVAFCVFSVMLFEKSPGDLTTLWNRLDGDNDQERFLRSDPVWHTSSPLWRRAAIEHLGGFDEQIMYGDDADLHTRALFAGLSYRKVDTLLPDVFIRRSAEDRITNNRSSRLLDSRMTRLERGTRLVKLQGTNRQQQIWEGQYFMEAEFLLFNVPESAERQVSVLHSWQREWSPPAARMLVATGYMAIARRTRNRGYFLLRLARRAAMQLLPESFFQRTTSHFPTATVAPGILETLRAKLSKHEELSR